MAEHTNIEWADATVNFWWGCQKVSPACEHCYAEALDKRFQWGDRGSKDPKNASALHWGPSAPRLLRLEAARQEAFRLQRKAKKQGRRLRVFTNSMADFFEDRRDLDGARLEALDVIRRTPDLDWMILTKRPEKIMDLLQQAWTPVYLRYTGGENAVGTLSIWLDEWLQGNAPANVWLGTTAENQEWADKRVPELLKVPAAVRFLSVEPMLGAVDLRKWIPHPADLEEIEEKSQSGRHQWRCRACNRITAGAEKECRTIGMTLGRNGLHWVINGGESGPHARPMHPDWVRSLRDQCAGAGVPFFFKQWGEWIALEDGAKCPAGARVPAGAMVGSFAADPHCFVARVGKKAAGRLLDGVEYNAFPEAVHA